MKALIVLFIAFLLILSSLGAMLAFNLWGAADRVSRTNFDRTVYRGNNSRQAWRAGGFVVVVFGLLAVALLISQAR